MGLLSRCHFVWNGQLARERDTINHGSQHWGRIPGVIRSSFRHTIIEWRNTELVFDGAAESRLKCFIAVGWLTGIVKNNFSQRPCDEAAILLHFGLRRLCASTSSPQQLTCFPFDPSAQNLCFNIMEIFRDCIVYVWIQWDSRSGTQFLCTYFSIFLSFIAWIKFNLLLSAWYKWLEWWKLGAVLFW